jgi:isocitrate lyase
MTRKEELEKIIKDAQTKLEAEKALADRLGEALRNTMNNADDEFDYFKAFGALTEWQERRRGE